MGPKPDEEVAASQTTQVARAPWLHDAAEVARTLGVDPATGLSAAEVADRLARFGPNRLESEPQLPLWRRVLGELADPIAYLLLVAVVLSLATWVLEGAEGTPFEAVVIAVIVVGNAGLRLVQQLKAEQAVAELQAMVAPTVVVVRDGREVRVPDDEVVPGDVLVLREGDVVGADGRLLEATGLMTTEASLTGESEPVVKDTASLSGHVALADRRNMVYAGTAVVRGSGRAVVTATGMATEVGRLAALLERTADDRTPLQREIDLVGRVFGAGSAAIAVVVVATILLTAGARSAADVAEILVLGVSLAVAAVPEGLPTILTVVLALGVHRMARRHAIVKKLAAVETLGSTSVICSDKTGTLTTGEMTIQRVVTASGDLVSTGVGYRPEGRFLLDGRPLGEGSAVDEAGDLLCAGSLAGNADLRSDGQGRWAAHGDPTDAAFLVAARKLGVLDECTARATRLGETPFSSERRRVTVVVTDGRRGYRTVVVTKGAPDVVLALCSREGVGSGTRVLDDRRRAEIHAAVETLAGAGLRTIAVAERELDATGAVEPDESLEQDMVFFGVVGMLDPPRPEVQASIRQAHQAGIRVIMITGDHPRTAARIAADLGIVPPDASVLAGVEIDDLDDETFADRLRAVSVFARVAPEHKMRIVLALKADGHVVAMTGDGVNDAPALKAADIGVAMGRTGTGVAKQAADMILTDDNFATIVSAVREGRTIFLNIRKFLRFMLGSNVGEVLTVFLGVVGAAAIGLDRDGEAVVAPLLAAQILWVNLVADTAPALALGVDPPPADVMERPPRRLTQRLIDRRLGGPGLLAGLVMALAALATLGAQRPGGLVDGSASTTEARTAAFNVVVLASLFNCLNSRSERDSAFRAPWGNPLLWWALAVSVSLQVAVVHVPVLNRGFTTAPLSAADWVLCVVMASAVLWVEELRKLWLRRSRRPAAPGWPGRRAEALHAQPDVARATMGAGSGGAGGGT